MVSNATNTKSINFNGSCSRVLRKSKSTWQSVPSHLKCDTAQQWAGPTREFTALHFLRLSHLYTEFLLHNLLASSSEISRESALKTAHEILKTVLLPTRKRDLLHSNRADHEWAVSSSWGCNKKPEPAQIQDTYILCS